MIEFKTNRIVKKMIKRQIEAQNQTWQSHSDILWFGDLESDEGIKWSKNICQKSITIDVLFAFNYSLRGQYLFLTVNEKENIANEVVDFFTKAHKEKYQRKDFDNYMEKN